ncbi:MAG: terminase small subunit, partial [Bacillota bacterium]
VEEYLVDLNATQAAIRAGYSPATAKDIGCENLAKPNIRAHIDTAMAELSKRTGVNQERVIRELAKVAFVNADNVVNMKDATVFEDASPDDLAAISSVKVKQTFGDYEGIEREVKLCDKLKALELLGKHFGMFTDKVNITGALPVQIVDDVDG